MRSLLNCTLIIPAILASIAFPCACRAAFELNITDPAERGCSNPDALGLINGSRGFNYWNPHISRETFDIAAHGYRPFGLAEIQAWAIMAGANVRGATGIRVSYRGLTALDYSERTLCLRMDLPHGNLYLQPGLRLANAAVPGVFQDLCAIVDFTAYDYVTPSLRVSFAVENALGSSLGVPGGSIPRCISAGVGYSPAGNVSCGLRIQKENGLRTSLATGLEWRAMQGVFIRLGSCTFPREISMGLGVRIKAISVDISTTANFDLGLSHQAGVTCAWQ